MVDFNLDDNMLGLNVAMINAGSVAGGLFAGQLCDRWGRKMGVAASALFTVVAVAIQASATKEAAFLVGRFLLGVAVTVNGTAAPVWAMEMAHPKRRGFYGGVYMAIWYFAATIVSCISLGTYQYESTWAWRGLAVVSPGETHQIDICDLSFLRVKSYHHCYAYHFFFSCQKVQDG